jgi:phosphoesterase RecJ-like protein
MLTIPQQINQLFTDKKNILVLFKFGGQIDNLAAACALSLYLQKIGKSPEIISPDLSLSANLKFIKDAEKIKYGFPHLQKFILKIDVKNTGIEELSYDKKDDELRIYITPKKGFLLKENIRTAQTDFRYDLIVTLGTTDLNSLGDLYLNNTELFYKTPLVNIDYRPANEHYGQINHLNLTATSVCEVLFDLFRQIGEGYIDEDIATNLLTGIISSSRSFKSDFVKPSTLTIAAKLMNAGANREKIVENLYRTKTVSTLKLWGVTLSHLQHDNSLGLVWSTITRDDLARSGAHENNIREMIDEVLSCTPEAEITLLLNEHENNGDKAIRGILRVIKNNDALVLAAPFAPRGNRNEVEFSIKGKTLSEAEKMVVEHLQAQLKASK